MARTPGSTRSTSRDNHSQHATTPSRTPQSKHRLHFPGIPKTPNPASAGGVPMEHPVEVIGRIRDLPDNTKGGGSSSRRGGENQPPAAPSSALEIAQDGRLVRVRTDIGHRDFALDGVSVSEEEDLSGFYCRFVEPRVRGVRSGGKCTVMMYGPTGSGKSHTMFGCARQPGIVYRALKDIMGGGPLKESGEEDGSSDGGSSNGDSVLLDDGGFGFGTFVQVAVLEIYNEEIYDLLSGSSATGGLPKGPNTPKVRLEVMGKKAKNATYITGNEAGKLSREVAKVEKRRIVKSTLCNERSSRSHCLIILDVPSVGGRLMLVDMAGSENIEQAGQAGFEAKMQTGKINQGNIALKRVVESIANGDSHVPFRDSKLTMLLQDSFEDDKSKILMILCASPDPREIHRTLATLEYGAKAKCIIRAAHIPTPRHDPSDPSSANNSMLGARIVALNQFICNLQVENQLKEKQRDEAQKELAKKEEELVRLRARLEAVEVTGRRESIVPSRKEDEESIKAKVEERTLMLRLQVQRMEEQMAQQQHELETLRRRLGEMEGSHSQGNNIPSNAGNEESSTRQEVIVGSGFARRLTEIYGEGGGAGEQDMLKSMEIDMGDHDVKEVVVTTTNNRSFQALHTPAVLEEVVEDGDRSSCYTASLADENVDAAGTHRKFCLSTVFEEEEQEVEAEEEEVEKAVVEESRVPRPALQEANSPSLLYNDHVEKDENGLELDGSTKPSSASRSTRIQNIFRLCGNHRQLSHQVVAKIAEETTTTDLSSPLQKTKQSDIKAPPPLAEGESPIRVLSLHLSKLDLSSDEKENSQPQYADGKGGLVDVYVKWEAAAKDLSSGALVTKLKVHNSSTLADLRKVVEAHLIDDTCGRKQQQQQAFTFLLLGDPTGSPVVREKEAAVQVSKLPVFNNQLSGHLACLRPAKTGAQLAAVAAAPTTLHLPLGPLENKVPVLPRIEGFSS